MEHISPDLRLPDPRERRENVDGHLQVQDRRRGPDRRGQVQPAEELSGIVAVIPAYNEARYIASVVFQTRLITNFVVVVDDGSSDRTAELARVAGAFVVSQPTNKGKAAALNVGFKAALQYEPSVIVCLDADAQHDPDEISEVVRPILEGEADVAVGSRFLTKKSRIPTWRMFGQHTLTAVTNLTSGLKTTDSQSGYRAFSPKAASLLHFRSSGLSVESEMQFLIKQAKLTLVEVPINVSYLDGNKRNPIVHGLHVLDAILSLVARRRPLLFFALPGFIMGCAGFFLGVRVFWSMQHDGVLLTGTALLTTLFLTGGLLLAITGVMLHSIGHLVRRLEEEIRFGFDARKDLLP